MVLHSSERAVAKAFSLDDATPTIVALDNWLDKIAMDGERLLVGEWLFHMPRNELAAVLRKETFSEKNMPDFAYRALFHRLIFRPSLQADPAAYLGIMHQDSRMIDCSFSPDDMK